MPQRQSRSIGLLGKLGAATMAVFVAFGLCELGLRIIAPAPPEPGREPQLLYQPDPAVGFLHVPNQVGWLDDGMATINAIGLRGELPATPKSKEAYRILAVGDSTTFGWGVGDEDTYPTELQRLLQRDLPDMHVEVVNGGVAAYDLTHDARLLEHFAPTLQPDMALVGLYWNDLPFEQVSPDGVAQGAVAESPDAPGRASTKTFRLGNQPSGWNRVLRSSRVLYTLRHAWLSMVAPTSAATNSVQWEMALLEGKQSPAIETAWKDIKTTLQSLRDYGQASKIAIGIVIMPIRAQVEKSYPNAQYQSRVRALAQSLGLFVIDPLPQFLEEPDHASLFIPYDRIHFSASGNRELAEAVDAALRARPEFHPVTTP